MSSNSKLKKAVMNSAEKLAKTSSEVVGIVKNSTKKRPNASFKEHKHCKICGKTISPSNEDLLCKSQSCIDKDEKDLKVKKQLRLWMGVLVIAILGGNLIQMGII